MIKETKKQITQDELKVLFTYNGSTGEFIRNELPKGMRSGRNKAGTVAGYNHSEGYRKIEINGKAYGVHRLAWLYVHGCIPAMVDHINHIVNDNRLCNLRATDYFSNNKNTTKRYDNKSGVVGVTKNKRLGKWQAGLMVNKKKIHLGMFAELEDTTKARKDAEVNYGFHKNHGCVRVDTQLPDAYRELIKQQTPTWLTENDKWMVELVYETAKERTKKYGIQFQVDHIVPLNGETVSGLRCPTNLQVIPWYGNLAKSNRYEREVA